MKSKTLKEDIAIVVLILIMIGLVVYAFCNMSKKHKSALSAKNDQIASLEAKLASGASQQDSALLASLAEANKKLSAAEKRAEDEAKAHQDQKAAHDAQDKLANDKLDGLQAKLVEMGEKCVIKPLVKRKAQPAAPAKVEEKKKEEPVVIINHIHIEKDPQAVAPQIIQVAPAAPKAEEKPYKRALPNDLLK